MRTLILTFVLSTISACGSAGGSDVRQPATSSTPVPYTISPVPILSPKQATPTTATVCGQVFVEKNTFVYEQQATTPVANGSYTTNGCQWEVIDGQLFGPPAGVTS